MLRVDPTSISPFFLLQSIQERLVAANKACQKREQQTLRQHRVAFPRSQPAVNVSLASFVSLGRNPIQRTNAGRNM